VNQSTLSHEQVLELTEMVRRVEEYYDVPMDTEWGYANGKLFCGKRGDLPTARLGSFSVYHIRL